MGADKGVRRRGDVRAPGRPGARGQPRARRRPHRPGAAARSAHGGRRPRRRRRRHRRDDGHGRHRAGPGHGAPATAVRANARAVPALHRPLRDAVVAPRRAARPRGPDRRRRLRRHPGGAVGDGRHGQVARRGGVRTAVRGPLSRWDLLAERRRRPADRTGAGRHPAGESVPLAGGGGPGDRDRRRGEPRRGPHPALPCRGAGRPLALGHRRSRRQPRRRRVPGVAPPRRRLPLRDHHPRSLPPGPGHRPARPRRPGRPRPADVPDRARRRRRARRRPRGRRSPGWPRDGPRHRRGEPRVEGQPGELARPVGRPRRGEGPLP